jgi:ribonuclease J
MFPGHAYAGELLFLYNAVRPRNVMPVHGTWRMLRANAKLAERTGVSPENIVLAENGVSVDLVAGRATIAGAVSTGKMFVDGLITGDVGDATLGERLVLTSGFIAVTVVVRRGTGKPAAPAHLQSRGFSEDPKALESVARKVEEELEALAFPEHHRSDANRAGRCVASSANGWARPTAGNR